MKLSKQLSVVWFKMLVGRLVQVLDGLECQKGKILIFTISFVIYFDDDLEINLLIWNRKLQRWHTQKHRHSQEMAVYGTL